MNTCKHMYDVGVIWMRHVFVNKHVLGCDCCDPFCVLRRSSAVPQVFSGSNPSGFLTKRKKGKTGENKKK